MEKTRSRTWLLVLYPEDETHCSALLKLNKGYQYVGVQHDRDVWEEGESPDHQAGEPKKIHWHIILKFPQARWNTAIADELGLADNYIMPCRDFPAAALYLLHTGYPEKAQYDPDDLFGPLVPSVKKLLDTDSDQNERVRSLLELIKAQDKILNVWDLIEIACDNGCYGDLIRMGSLVRDLVEIHNLKYT